MKFKSRASFIFIYLLLLSGVYSSNIHPDKKLGVEDKIKKNLAVDNTIYQLEGDERDMVSSGPITIAAEVLRINGLAPLTMRYKVEDSASDLSLRLFEGCENVEMVTNLQLTVEIEDKRSDKSETIRFATSGIFDSLPKLKKMAHVTVSFTSDVIVDLQEGTKGIIANSITSNQATENSVGEFLQDVGLYFTNKEKPVTLKVEIKEDGSNLLFGEISDSGNTHFSNDYYISGVFVIGDTLSINRSPPQNPSSYPVFNTLGQNVNTKLRYFIFDVSSLVLADSVGDGLTVNIICEQMVQIDYAMILIRESLINPIDSMVVALNGVSKLGGVLSYIWVDITIDTLSPDFIFNAIGETTTMFSDGYVILRKTATGVIETTDLYFLGELYYQTVAKNMYVKLIGFTTTMEPFMYDGSYSISQQMKVYVIGDGKDYQGIEKIEETALINDLSNKLPGFLAGGSDSNSIIYLKSMPYYNGNYIVDIYSTFIETGIEFNQNERYLKINNIIVYDLNDYNVLFTEAGQVIDNFIHVSLLYPPINDVKINGVCSGDAETVECTTSEQILNSNRYEVVDSYKLPLKTPESSSTVCMEISSESAEDVFDGFTKKICHTLYNANYVPTGQPGAVECTEGETCKFNANLNGIATGIFSSQVTIPGHGTIKTGTSFCGVSYCTFEFVYPLNHKDDDDIYVVDVEVQVKVVGINSGKGNIKINVHDVDTSGYSVRSVINSNDNNEEEIKEEIGKVYVKLNTIPSSPVSINYICPSSLKCESDGLNEISDMTEHSITVKREYTTIYDYNKESTSFTMSFLSSTTNDIKYSIIKPNDEILIVKNDIKPELKMKEESISYICEQSESSVYHITFTRIPKSSIKVNVNYNAEELNINPNSGILSNEKNEIKFSVNPIRICRGNVSYEINHVIESNDELYKNVKIDAIKFDNLVYENQLDQTSAPVLQYVSESDTSYSLNIEFNKKCYIDDIKVNEEFDCSKIFKANNYGLSKCKFVNDNHVIGNYTNKNANSEPLVLVEGVIRGSENGIKTSSGSRSIFGRSLPPYIDSAYFSDDGSKIICEFDLDIVEGISDIAEPCSKILDNTNLGTNSMCRLSSSRILEISLGSDAIIKINSYISLKSNSGIKAVKDHLFSATGMTPIATAKNPIKITAIINAPDEVGECASVVIDGSLSESHGGRKPIYIWGYGTGEDDDNYEASAKLKNCINDANSKNEASLNIKGNYLKEGINPITLKIKSFLNIESDTVYKNIIGKKDGSSIEVTISGSSIQNYTKQESFSISAKSSISVCDSISEMNIKFEWIGKNIKTNEMIDMSKFVTANPRILNIASKSLEIGKYEFIVKVNSSDDSLKSSSSLIVNIVASDLIIVLSGGGSDRVQNSHNVLILDISKSYDIDEYENEFNYIWECVMNGINQCIDVNGKLLELESKSIIEIGENVLRANNSYAFTGRMLGIKTDRSSSITINVKVIEEKIDLSINLKVSSVDHIYNPSDIFSIESEIITSITDVSEMSYKWSYPKNELNTNMFIGSMESNKIEVDCSKLSYGKESILFSLSYKKMIFKSEYVFEIHSPPIGGYLIVNNKSIEFGEEIEIRSSGWVSKSKLSYRFGVLLSDESNIQYLNDYSLNNKYNGIIPVGNAANDYKVTIVVMVKDSRSVWSYSYKDSEGNPVIIQSNVLDTSDPQKAEETVTNLVEKAKNVSEYDQIYTIVNSVSNQLTAGVCNSSNINNNNNNNNGDNEENKNVCLNGGNCVNNFCNCSSEFTGKYCENHKPIDCELSSEYEYGEYDRSCGIGHRKRWHPIKSEAKYGGKECEIIMEEDKSVYLGACNSDVDGKWGEWSEWSECDAVCKIFNGINAYGIQKRSRKCNSPLPSGNGKNCEGESTEIQKCSKPCITPYKPCPGQTIDNDGNLQGKECSGNGVCEYSKRPCFAYQAGCISFCTCNAGYDGESCNIELNELEKKRRMNEILAKSLEDAFSHSTNSLESHSLLSTSLFNLANPPVELYESTKKDTLKLIDNIIDKLKENNNNNNNKESVSVEPLKSYIETSILFFNEEVINNTKTESNSDYYSKSLLNVISNISSIYASNPNSNNNNNNKESLSLHSDSVSVDLINRKETEMILKTNENEIELNEDVKGNTLEVIEWKNVPYNEIKEDNLTSGLLSITIHSEEGKRNIKDLSKPIFFTQKVSNYGSLKDIECSYFDEELGKMTYEGVYVYYIEKMSNNTALVTCATVHLSSFSTKMEKIIPKMNFVNPISDAHLLGNYNKENMIVPIILSVVIVICCLTFLYAKYTDSNELSIVTKEKAEKFLSVGLLDEKVAEKQHEKEAKTFLAKFLMNMKEHHSWLAPTLRPIDEIVVINRSQRILCLTCQLMTSTSINALFFGSNAENIGQLISTSIISTLCMLPCTIIIPWLYKYANGCSSKTISNKRKWFSIKSLRNRFKSYLSSGISTPELLRLKAGLLITSGILLLVCILFYILSLIIMPFGAPSLITTLCLIIMIIEMLFSFICSNILSKPGFIYLFVVDLLIFVIDVIFLILCACISNKSYGLIYNMWKALSKNVATKEFNKYIENSLDCCGFYEISDYNVNDCYDKSISGEIIQSCNVPLSETFNKYSGMWGVFFMLCLLLMLIKMSMIGGYLLVNMNKIISEENDYENEITKIAGNKMINFLRRSVMKNKIRRKKEYVEWLRQRRIRSTITICVNTTVFIYIVVMIYINLLYGVKFSPNQANSWIISSAISMSIDFFIQQPSLILLNSVASSTMGAVLNFAS